MAFLIWKPFDHSYFNGRVFETFCSNASQIRKFICTFLIENFYCGFSPKILLPWCVWVVRGAWQHPLIGQPQRITCHIFVFPAELRFHFNGVADSRFQRGNCTQVLITQKRSLILYWWHIKCRSSASTPHHLSVYLYVSTCISAAIVYFLFGNSIWCVCFADLLDSYSYFSSRISALSVRCRNLHFMCVNFRRFAPFRNYHDCEPDTWAFENRIFFS